jgi:solute carrier family 41
MTLFGVMSTLLVLSAGTLAPFFVIGLVILWAIVCAYVVLRNEYAKALLKQGWSPLFGAMAITSASGIVLDLFVSRYDGYALLAVAFGGTYRSSALDDAPHTPHGLIRNSFLSRL